MTTANDSILVTPGSGATVATQLVDSKEYQVVIAANSRGMMVGTADTWIANTGNTAHVAAARTTMIDIFNASGSGLTMVIHGIYVIPALAAVTGVGQTYEVIRTSAVGTGGTTITPASFDPNNTALPAQITARTKPTGGATTSATLLFLNGSSEETSAYATNASQLNHVPVSNMDFPQRIVLPVGFGIKIDQTTNSSVGNVNFSVVFTVE